MDYTKRFEAKYKMPMNAFSPFFYANVQVLLAAIRRPGR